MAMPSHCHSLCNHTASRTQPSHHRYAITPASLFNGSVIDMEWLAQRIRKPQTVAINTKKSGILRLPLTEGYIHICHTEKQWEPPCCGMENSALSVRSTSRILSVWASSDLLLPEATRKNGC